MKEAARQGLIEVKEMGNLYVLIRLQKIKPTRSGLPIKKRMRLPIDRYILLFILSSVTAEQQAPPGRQG